MLPGTPPCAQSPGACKPIPALTGAVLSPSALPSLIACPYEVCTCAMKAQFDVVGNTCCLTEVFDAIETRMGFKPDQAISHPPVMAV